MVKKTWKKSLVDKGMVGPVWIWLILIIFGMIVKYLRIYSSFFIIVGFAGLTVFTCGEIIKKNRKTLYYYLFFLGIDFMLILYWGAYFNYGYPINEAGVKVYVVSLLIFTVYYWIRLKVIGK